MGRVNSVGGTPVWHETGSRGASLVRAPQGGLTDEEKFAKKIIAQVGHVGFDEESLAYFLCSMGGVPMQESVMSFARAIIRTYAMQYDAGIQTDVTKKAKELHR